MTTTDLTLSATEVLEKCPRPHILGPQPSACHRRSRQPPAAHVQRLTARAEAAQCLRCACAHGAAPSPVLAGSRRFVPVVTKPGALGGGAAGRGVERAGRGALGGATHVESFAQSLCRRGTSGPLRTSRAGLMAALIYKASNYDGR